MNRAKQSKMRHSCNQSSTMENYQSMLGRICNNNGDMAQLMENVYEEIISNINHVTKTQLVVLSDANEVITEFPKRVKTSMAKTIFEKSRKLNKLVVTNREACFPLRDMYENIVGFVQCSKATNFLEADLEILRQVHYFAQLSFPACVRVNNMEFEIEGMENQGDSTNIPHSEGSTTCTTSSIDDTSSCNGCFTKTVSIAIIDATVNLLGNSIRHEYNGNELIQHALMCLLACDNCCIFEFDYLLQRWTVSNSSTGTGEMEAKYCEKVFPSPDLTSDTLVVLSGNQDKMFIHYTNERVAVLSRREHEETFSRHEVDAVKVFLGTIANQTLALKAQHDEAQQQVAMYRTIDQRLQDSCAKGLRTVEEVLTELCEAQVRVSKSATEFDNLEHMDFKRSNGRVYLCRPHDRPFSLVERHIGEYIAPMILSLFNPVSHPGDSEHTQEVLREKHTYLEYIASGKVIFDSLEKEVKRLTECLEFEQTALERITSTLQSSLVAKDIDTVAYSGMFDHVVENMKDTRRQLVNKTKEAGIVSKQVHDLTRSLEARDEIVTLLQNQLDQTMKQCETLAATIKERDSIVLEEVSTQTHELNPVHHHVSVQTEAEKPAKNHQITIRGVVTGTLVETPIERSSAPFHTQVGVNYKQMFASEALKREATTKELAKQRKHNEKQQKRSIQYAERLQENLSQVLDVAHRCDYKAKVLELAILKMIREFRGSKSAKGHLQSNSNESNMHEGRIHILQQEIMENALCNTKYIGGTIQSTMNRLEKRQFSIDQELDSSEQALKILHGKTMSLKSKYKTCKGRYHQLESQIVTFREQVIHRRKRDVLV